MADSSSYRAVEKVKRKFALLFNDYTTHLFQRETFLTSGEVLLVRPVSAWWAELSLPHHVTLGEGLGWGVWSVSKQCRSRWSIP